MKGVLAHFAERYIAGETRAEAIERGQELNKDGLLITFDHLGEGVTEAAEAKSSVEEYVSLLKDIKESGVDASVSIKLTQLGLDISTEFAETNARKVVEVAERLGNFVRVDMESSVHTAMTLDIVTSIHKSFPNIGVAVQSYLKRSETDVWRLVDEGVSIRLVKGAYKEPPRVAFTEKKRVDENFSRLMRELLLKGNAPAIATHDVTLINEAKTFARANGIKKEAVEFQMLLGINTKLQKELAGEGFRVKVYVPYGKDWLPYTMRRLAERKENVFFVLRHLLD